MITFVLFKPLFTNSYKKSTFMAQNKMDVIVFKNLNAVKLKLYKHQRKGKIHKKSIFLSGNFSIFSFVVLHKRDQQNLSGKLRINIIHSMKMDKDRRKYILFLKFPYDFSILTPTPSLLS